MTPSAKQGFVVTLSGSHPAADVAQELTQRGFTVGNILDAIGVVTGTASVATLHELRAVPGVADVSEDHVVDIGPPGAPIA